MTERPRGRWLRRAAALVAGAPLLAGLLQVPAAQEAHAAPSGSRTVDVDIDSLSPPAAGKDDDAVTVTGSITNEGRTTITDGHIGLRRGPVLNNRSSIDDVARRTGYSASLDGQEVGGKTEKIKKLAPGVSQSFSLRVPVKKLHLSKDGVYQLGVSFSGRSQGAPYQQVLGIERTFLPWQEAEASKKTKLTYMWPLISKTHLTAETEGDEQQTPIFRDDKLAAEIAPGGRLQQLVALGKDLPVTFVVDPDLLATVDAMTGRYKVEGPHGTTRPGRNQEVAKQWLSDLEQAIQAHEVVALPFGDPDIASLAHKGRIVPSALSHLGPATDLASKTVETVLPGVKARTDFAWPVDGAVDSSVVDVATSAGAHHVIARSDSMRERLSYTPTSARPIGGGNTAVVADAGLSTAFTGDLSKAGAANLAVQNFLAQSLMVNLQDPSRQRSIVVAPQRMPTASQAQAMAKAVRALDDSGWAEAQDLSDAAKAKPDPNATRQVPGVASYPSSLRKQELPAAAFRQAQETRTALDDFKVILAEPWRVETPFGNAIMRMISTEWRGDAKGATAFRKSVRSYLDGLTTKVHLIQKSDATLSGRSATIPVTVQNNLVRGVKGMTLRLTSSQPNRLDVGEPQTIDVEGGHSQSFKFDTTANANGPVQVTAQLFTADGKRYGRAMTFEVNVTEITATVMLVIAGGVLLLVLAGVRIYLQRKRAAAREDDGGADGGTGTDDGGAGSDDGDGTPDRDGTGHDGTGQDGRPAGDGGSGQPGDPGPDTGSENTDASGSGEKVDR
ncbi:DUF6049 family protein [Streptomyces sp. Ru73]|uniref:DUF6049 family protein n=1 Tax=Streptomyces sp. Ru73 TaxID=2080748 RepID=UPI002156326B|nr:DUF6049 family protein [Streptomyces sp. Ru73]